MKRLRFYLNLKQSLQLQCVSVLLLTSSQWHTETCQPTWQDLPLWALMGFGMWRLATAFHLAPRAHAVAVAAPAPRQPPRAVAATPA